MPGTGNMAVGHTILYSWDSHKEAEEAALSDRSSGVGMQGEVGSHRALGACPSEDVLSEEGQGQSGIVTPHSADKSGTLPRK